jgi:glycosyltransferase involved in cell wall biosynthesis
VQISVVIPAYNAGRYLDEALESVFAGTMCPDEVIVVDDGSTDAETTDVLQRWSTRIRIHRQPNGGIGAARNAGVRLASHEWIAFLDADDIWLPDKLARQQREYESDPDVALISASIEAFVSPEVPEAMRRELSYVQTHATGFLPSSVLVRRSVFPVVGYFSEQLRAGEFIEWGARLRLEGLPCRHVPEALVRRRIHASNTGRRNPDAKADYTRAMREVLARRRQKEQVDRP